MELSTRKVVHFNVTEYPKFEWIKQQIRNALFDEEEPTFIIHDNDGKFGQFGHPAQIEKEGKKKSC